MERKSSSLSSILRITAGTVIGQSLFVLLMPLLTRLYEPRHFGESAAYIATASILAAVAALRYENAIPLPKEQSDSVCITLLCLLLSVITTFTTGVIFLVISLSQWHTILASYLPLWYLIPGGMLLLSAYQTFSFWAVRNKDYHRISQTKVLQGIAGVATQVFMGLSHIGTLGLVAGEIVARSAGFISLSHGFRRSLVKFDIESMRELMRRYQRFAWLGVPDALVNASLANLPSILFVPLFGVEETGKFSLMNRLLFAPAGVINQAIAQVYLGQASKSLHDGERLDRVFLNFLIKILKYFFITYFIFGIVLVPIFINLFFERSWQPMALLAFPLSLMHGSSLITSPLSPTLNVIQKQNILLYWNIYRLVATLFICFISSNYGFSLLTTIWFLGFHSLIAYLVLLGIIWRQVR